ncbi:MAG: hypothetical protein KAS32_25335, partial [Candidatus Peribacteraceae bacterium]|nr:hypothetical protein [Candidatus Peribacteraceae bacterium]
MRKMYTLNLDFCHFKKGDTVEVTSEIDKMAQIIDKGNEFFIPKILLEKAAAPPKKTTKVSMTITKGEVTDLGDLLAGAAGNFKDEGDAKRLEDVSIETAVQVVEIKLEPNQFFLSDVTNGRLPDSKIDHIMTRFDLTDWSEDEQKDIPPIDPSHYWDANLLEAMWVSHKLNKKMLLTGYP